jgi:glycosyltransferase involved in cell wall biosynthesis
MKFSVVVANYNNGKYLPALIESVQKQTYVNWELVIADDCSTDNSLEIIALFLSDERIKVISHKQNQGAGAAFRTATENSTGPIIGMLGADDALPPNAIAEMVNAHLACPQASFIYSTHFECDSELKVIDEKGFFGQGIPKGKSQIHQIYATNFATFKKEAYLKTEGFNPKLKRAVDQDLFLKLEEVGEVVFIDKPLYYYRRHAGGISQEGNSEKARMFHIMAMYHAYQRRKKTGFINLTKDEMRYYLRYYCLYQAEHNLQEGILKRGSYLLKDLYFIPTDIKRKEFWQVLGKILGFYQGQTIIKKGHIVP